MTISGNLFRLKCQQKTLPNLNKLNNFLKLCLATLNKFTLLKKRYFRDYKERVSARLR